MRLLQLPHPTRRTCMVRGIAAAVLIAGAGAQSTIHTVTDTDTTAEAGRSVALWEDLDPAMRQLFLRLMEQFDLSYRTLLDKDISLLY